MTRIDLVADRMAAAEPVDMPADLVGQTNLHDQGGDQGGDRGPVDPQEADDRPLRAAAFDENDVGNGRRFVLYYGDGLLSVPRVGWFVWDGARWRLDADNIEVRKLGQTIADKIKREPAAMGLSPKKQAKVDRLDDLTAELATLEASDLGDAEKEEGRRKIGALLREIAGLKAELAKAKSGRFSFAKTTGNTGRINNMIEEAAANLSRSIDDLDADPLTVNCRNATLRFVVERRPDGSKKARMAVQPHDRSDLLTKVCDVDYDPRARADRFDAFLAQVVPDAEIRDFLRRTFGLSMTGELVQFLWFFYGHGANGKSVLVDLIARVLGDYSATAKIESLTGQNRRSAGDATPDLVPLMGARMVRASEPEEGERLQEAMIKALTGSEPMQVRALNKDFVEVQPKFKLLISGNHKPVIFGTDDGIWRRMLLVQFGVQIPEHERDLHLTDKLFREASGVLNWMIAGLIDYLENGLQIPDAVKAATQEYREDSDPMGAFLRNCCEVQPSGGVFTSTKELVAAFRYAMISDGETPWQDRKISLRLKERSDRWVDPKTGAKYTTAKRSVKGYLGLKIKDRFARYMLDHPDPEKAPKFEGDWSDGPKTSGDVPDPFDRF